MKKPYQIEAQRAVKQFEAMPAIRIGRRVLIGRESLEQWLRQVENAAEISPDE